MVHLDEVNSKNPNYNDKQAYSFSVKEREEFYSIY